MELRKVAETNATITLGWDPPAGVEWYLFYANGVRVSNAAPVDKNGNVKNTVKFSKPGEPYQVVAVLRKAGAFSLDVGTYTTASPPPPPPPPPPSGDWFPASWYSGPSNDAIFKQAMPPRKGSLVGIWDSGHPGITRIVQRETEVGRRFDFGAASYAGYMPNFDGKVTLIRNDGRHILLDAGTYGAGNAQGILNGSRDSFISQWVQAASNCNPGGPVFVRHFHEYAGPWMPSYYYTAGVRCTPEQWRDMNRRPVDIANSLNIRNIIWIWCATIYDDRPAVFASYPGDAYVDIVGDDNYGYADTQWMGDVFAWAEHWEVHNYCVRYPVGDPRREQFKSLHEAFPNKPFAVMETGRAPHSTNADLKRQWLAKMPVDAPTYLPRMVFHTYSDYGLEADPNGKPWTLDIPTSALQGYREAVHNSYFKTRPGVDL